MDILAYVPEPVPNSIPSETAEYLHRELLRISASVRGLGEQFVFASAVPTTGSHRLGEVVFNDGTITSIATVDHWRCTVAGVPGTWIVK